MDLKRDKTRWRFYLFATAVSVFLPVLVWRFSLLVAPDSYRQLPYVLKIFATCASAAIALAAYVELGRERDIPLDRVISIVLGILVSFFFLGIISADTFKTYDYGCYENAARAIVQGQNPYRDCYLYPPLMAQVMAHLCMAVEWSASKSGLLVPKSVFWNTVFYLYQCGQFFLTVLAYLLCYRFSRKIGLSRLKSSAFTTGLLVFNNPLMHTLKEKQVNLWVADLILLGLITAWKYPLVSGWAIALSTHIKLYPAALMIPCAFCRQKRLIVGFASAVALIALALAAWEGDAHLWSAYAGFMISFPEQRLPGNLSLNGFLMHCLGLAGLSADAGKATFRYFAGAVLMLAKCAVVAWFAVRFVRREKSSRATSSNAHDPRSSMFRFYDHSMDILALSLIVSPILWDHHFVLALPLALWVVAIRGRRYPWHTGIGIFLLLGQPSVDLFPLFYHRLAGLFLLLWTTQQTPQNSP